MTDQPFIRTYSPPTPAVQPYLVVSIEADSRAAANVSVNRKLLFTLAYGKNAGAIEQQGWHEPTAIAARVIKVPLVVCRQCRRFLLAGRAQGIASGGPSVPPRADSAPIFEPKLYDGLPTPSIPQFDEGCPLSPAADRPMPVRNAGTSTMVTCSPVRSRSAAATRMMKTRGMALQFPSGLTPRRTSGRNRRQLRRSPLRFRSRVEGFFGEANHRRNQVR